MMKRYLLLLSAITLTVSAIGQQVLTGLEVLEKNGFSQLKGKRVGLVTNPTGVDRNLRSSIDIIYRAPGVKLVALFGPEHGVRGDYSAGDLVGSATDPLTGLTVYSLYGSTRKPTAGMLKGIDVLVYDIQDTGIRSYTYISTMGLVMEAAAENNIKVLVLDRPNPLGGKRIEGPVVEKEFISFVSQFPVPYVYGLTAGELAMLINGEKMLPRNLKCDLEVVKMEGWKREMLFEDTGLPWVPSSPHIPHAGTAAFNLATGIIGELGVLSVGVGYTIPFEAVGAEWINADSLAGALNSLGLKGIMFRPLHYRPYYSVSQGKTIHGVQLHLTSPEDAPLGLIQFYIMQELYNLYPGRDIFRMCEASRIDMFDKVCGTDKVRKSFTSNWKVSSILPLWEKDIASFRQSSLKYQVYR